MRLSAARSASRVDGLVPARSMIEGAGRATLICRNGGPVDLRSLAMHQPTAASKGAAYLYYRHALPVRIMHWINVIALTILFMSGLNIFSAHPDLYWGKSSYSQRPAILQIG